MPLSNSATADGSTTQSGYAFVSNRELSPYHVSPINAVKIYELSDNIYVSGPTSQITNMVISGEPKITIYDDKDDVVEDVSRNLNKMFSKPTCSLSACARSSAMDLMIWGTSVYNWVWELVGGRLECTELIHLHPFTFKDAPPGNHDKRSYGRLLYGIYYDSDDRKMHYCQNQKTSGTPIELPHENLFVIQDPSAAYPDGDSRVYPIAPLVDFLNYAWNTLSQQMFRTGAPIIFIKINNPQPARTINGVTLPSDEDYAKEILSDWGKDTQFSLRPNMEVMQIDVDEGSLAIHAINKANESIRDFFSPVGMLGRDGTLIAGSQTASLSLVNSYIKGWVALLENALCELPNYYLRHNGYPESWRAEVTIPHNSFEDANLKLQQAQMLINSKTGTPNEVRELLGFEGVGDDELNQISEGWKALGIGGTSQFMMAETDNPKPNRTSYEKRNKISREAENSIVDSTEDLLRAALKLARRDKGAE